MGVRWDAAVGTSRFWAAPARAAPLERAAPLVARVELFGALAARAPARSYLVDLPDGGSVNDVVRQVARRAGAEFASRALDAGGALHRCCRAFVDGAPVENPGTRITATRRAARIELILLTAAEGG